MAKSVFDRNAFAERMAQTARPSGGVDYTEERKRVQEYRENHVIKLKVGDNRLRILPNPADPSFPFLVIRMHRDKTLGIKYQPMVLDEDDPIMEYAEILKGETLKVVSNEGWKLTPNPIYYAFAIDRSQETKGIQLYKISETIMAILQKFLEDEGETEFFNLEEGFDINFVGAKKQMPDGEITVCNTAILLRKPTKALSDLKVLKNAFYPDPMEITIRKTREELMKVVETFKTSVIAPLRGNFGAEVGNEPGTRGVPAAINALPPKTDAGETFGSLFPKAPTAQAFEPSLAGSYDDLPF